MAYITHDLAWLINPPVPYRSQILEPAFATSYCFFIVFEQSTQVSISSLHLPPFHTSHLTSEEWQYCPYGTS